MEDVHFLHDELSRLVIALHSIVFVRPARKRILNRLEVAMECSQPIPIRRIVPLANVNLLSN